MDAARRLTFGVDVDRRHTASASFLDPEIIRVTGAFSCKQQGFYLLQSRVIAERETPVELRHIRNTIQRVFLNGREVKDQLAKLRPGENRLILIYHTVFSSQRRSSNYNGEHAGCFLRLVKPGTAQRIAAVAFEPPAG